MTEDSGCGSSKKYACVLISPEKLQQKADFFSWFMLRHFGLNWEDPDIMHIQAWQQFLNDKDLQAIYAKVEEDFLNGATVYVEHAAPKN